MQCSIEISGIRSRSSCETPPGNGVTYKANPSLPGRPQLQPARPPITPRLSLATPRRSLTARGIYSIC